MGVRERRKREEGARLASIIAAAEKVFAGHGYFHARMDDIAEAAELAKGTLYYYFKSKDEIYLHILGREARKAHKEIRRRISGTSTFIEALEQTTEFFLEYFEKNPNYFRMFLPYTCGVIHFEDTALLKKSADDYKNSGKFIRELLKKKMPGERLPFSLDELLKFLKTMQIGIGIKLLEGHKAEAKAAAGFFINLIKRVLEDEK